MDANLKELNQITSKIIESAIKIHNQLGPGLFESVYEEILSFVLEREGFLIERQVPLPVNFENVRMEIGFRIDIIVEKKVLIEIKSIEAIAPVHKKQLLTYLKLANMPLGLLINFNEEFLKKGITRIINTYS